MNANALTPQQQNGGNIILSDRHRVALSEWTVDNYKHSGDDRVSSTPAYFHWVTQSGYDGVEASVRFFQRFFPNIPLEQVALKAKEEAKKFGVPIFGCNIWWITDDYINDQNFAANLAKDIQLAQLMGAQYVTFQIWLSPEYIGTGGAYRRDENFLKQRAAVIDECHRLCYEYGLNCYIETHVDRVSEDLEAFTKIMRLCEYKFEVNGDLSHYVFKNIHKGDDLEQVISRMGHTHQRIARPFGDLSFYVDDLRTDWMNGGATWKAFEITKPALRRGLSSRVIVGETGPIHNVRDAPLYDAQLLPLWRLMANYADSYVSGKNQEIEIPQAVPDMFWSPDSSDMELMER